MKIAETIYTPFQKGHFWPVLTVSCNCQNAQNKNVWIKIYFINGSILVLTKVYWELKSNNLQANIATLMSAYFPCNRNFSPIKMVKDWKLFYRKIIKSKTAFKMAKK